VQAKVLHKHYTARGTQPQPGYLDIDLTVAIMAVKEAAEALLEIAGPRSMATSMIEQGACVLKTTTVSCALGEGVKKVAVVQNGQLVMDSKEGVKEATIGLVSTALAAQFTASTATIATLPIQEVASKQARKGETLNMATTKMLLYPPWNVEFGPERMVPWTYDAMANVANARDYYLSLQTDDQLRIQSLITPPQSDRRVTTKAKVTGFQVDGNGVVMPGTVALGSPKSVTLVAAYMHLSKHRSIRGQDKKHISQLTTGYYLFSMLRDLEQPLVKAIDILNFFQQMKITRKLTLPPRALHPYSIAILAANGFTIRLLTHNTALSGQAISETQTSVRWVTDYDESIVYVPQYHGSMPYVDKHNKLVCNGINNSLMGIRRNNRHLLERKIKLKIVGQ